MTPRILYLSPHWPDRGTGASELRSRSIARALRHIGDVEFIVVNDPDNAEGMAVAPAPDFNVTYSVTVSPHRNVTWGRKLRWLAAPRASYPHGCGVTDRDMRRVIHTARDFDLIWFFKLRTPNMFPCWTWTRSVVDVDDVPSTYAQTLMQTAESTTERLAAAVRMISWQRRDRLLDDRFSVLGVCSENDKRYLRRLGVNKPVHVIPNGFDVPATTPVRRPSTPARFGFIGLFDYEPNLSGIQWFVRECWPAVKRAIPDARLRLLGRGSDGPLKPAGPDIDGLGWVPDAAAEMATWSGMVVPIHVGAGTRGKIAHAFSVKCPVVSTSLGAYGYDVRDGRELLLAESPADFAAACIRIVTEPDSGEAMAERAWQQFLTHWSWTAIEPRVWATAEECLRGYHRVS